MTPATTIAAIKEGLLSFNPSQSYRFWATCESLPGQVPACETSDKAWEGAGQLIQHLTDEAKQISYRTFAKHADLEPLRRDDHPAMYRISAPDNWAISFWRSTLPSGQTVYFFDWSRIEHIFVDEEVDLARELELLRAKENPAPVPPLPVIKRGVYPQLVLGQMGRKASFRYRGWTFEVYPTVRTPADRPWSVHAIAPGAATGEHGWSYSFDGAICVGKILIDLREAARSLGSWEGRMLEQMWHHILKSAIHAVEAGYPPNRATVARELQVDVDKQLRRGGGLSPAFTWWFARSLPERISLIDDELEEQHCSRGPDPKGWA